jgi:hypothetical protein
MSIEIGDKSLKESFLEELTKESSDPVLDIAEIGLDNIFDNKIIDEVPVLKTIAATCKIGLNIRDRYFARKLISFINNFRADRLSNEDYNEFKTSMEDKKYRDKVTETIIVKIDALDSINKTIILSKLFNAFLNKRINWEEFLEFSNVANYLVKEDYETLELLNQDPNNHICFSIHERKDLIGSAYKLVQYSLASYEVIMMMFCGSSPGTILHKISASGIKFCNSLNVER